MTLNQLLITFWKIHMTRILNETVIRATPLCLLCLPAGSQLLLHSSYQTLVHVNWALVNVVKLFWTMRVSCIVPVSKDPPNSWSNIPPFDSPLKLMNCDSSRILLTANYFLVNSNVNKSKPHLINPDYFNSEFISFSSLYHIKISFDFIWFCIIWHYLTSWWSI